MDVSVKMLFYPINAWLWYTYDPATIHGTDLGFVVKSWIIKYYICILFYYYYFIVLGILDLNLTTPKTQLT